jgi:hypothetical protein
MQENLSGSYKEVLIPVPKPRPNPEEEKDLNKAFIPPIPAFLNVISALMILRQKITINETTNDIGNGKTKDIMTTIPREISNQTR